MSDIDPRLVATPAAPAIQSAAPAAQPSNKVLVTYLPHDGDNDVTDVSGREFMAGVAVELDPTKQKDAIVLGHLQGNPWFHIGSDAPQSPKATAIAERAASRLVHLKEIVADFEAGKVTHAHGDRLKAIADAIQESAR
jgi:hypothetical protein